jgi:type 1 fimbria pilin
MRKLVVLVGLVAMLATGATSTAASVPPFPKLEGKWSHADINVKIDRKPHTVTLDRGRITQVSAAQLTLRESDGSAFVIPLTSFAIVRIYGSPATIFQLRRGMNAMTMRIDGGPAVRIRVQR